MNLYTKLILILVGFLVNIDLKGQADTTEKSITILFTGDIMGHDTQIASAFDPETGKYDYNSVFQYIKPVLSSADVTIANLEVTLAGPPYKGYPQFSSPAELAVAGINAGIDCYALSNNHSVDRGGKGIISTIHKLDSIGIPHTGTYRNASERDSLSPLMISKNGFNLALLNYTYGTNGLKAPAPVIVDTINRKLIVDDIMKARAKDADAVILFIHWGVEYDTIPAGSQTELADFCLKNGADLVIGSHPHVIQEMTWIRQPETRDRFVVYSLGNFVSNQRKPKTDGGSLVKIELVKRSGKISINEAGYFLTWVHTPVENLKTRFYILPCSQFEQQTDYTMTESDRMLMNRFINESRNLLKTRNTGISEYIFNGNEWVPGDF